MSKPLTYKVFFCTLASNEPALPEAYCCFAATGGDTDMVMFFVSFAPLDRFSTATVKEKRPVFVGLPAIVPEELSERPSGKAPSVML